MKTGTLVDAAIIASASEDDEDGHWVKHKGRPAFHCFKAHVDAYADTALVEEIAVTAPTPRTARPFLMLCPTIPAMCFPTAPTESSRRRGARQGWKAAHRRNRYVGARRGRKLDAWNQPIHRIVVGSRRSSAPVNEAATFAGCDGEGWQTRPFKFAALRSPTV
ncbi:hypothetical protein X737_34465 [Mesorhizobium sp. L48C026A00]|nr:hypothetical protein X737_34465 [Mesorhizobium sp. L48C026A00]